MPELLSFPFRLRPNGSVATVEQGGDQSNKELIAMLALTRYGERPLAPAFGMSDPVMSAFQGTELAAQVAAWGPPVRIVSVSTQVESESEQTVTVEFI